MDYKNTINLPNTAFPMKANLANREPGMLKDWEQRGLYHLIQRHTADRERTYVLHDGPPYANGNIHIGHAVNKVLKDFIVKSRLMAGYRSPYLPGWDCHGLPIEHQVEKKSGKVGRKIDARTFRQKCREYADRQIDNQRQDFKRLGVLGEWDQPYQTKDFQYEANIVRALARIVENGHVLKGIKPVNWCFDCGSALAEAEIDYQDKVSTAVDVLYTAVDAEQMCERFGIEYNGQLTGIPIWTTTPWTLPASQAVALNAELQYQLIRGHWQDQELLMVVAADLAAAVTARIGLQGSDTLGIVAGGELEGLQLNHPFYERQVPVILGEHVTLEAGTGAVHTAPGHGQEDFEMGQQYGLEIDNPVAASGVYIAGTPYFEGVHVWKANDQIVELVRERCLLLHDEPFEHSYPHCWRHKSPTAFRVTPQWFISMKQAGLRDQALAAIAQVRWVPGWGEDRIAGMVENRPDWCISRQRTWGVPIMFFIHQETGELHPDTVALMRRAADRVEQHGIDWWYEDHAFENLDVNPEDYERVTDILDVWFDSGVSHFCVLDVEEGLSTPCDMYLEGSDQHRGWFQSSLLTSVAIKGRAPYRQVLTHGFTVDAEGRKMSKSMGNVVAPQEVMKTLGADVLRLWIAAADYRQEMSVSDEILKRVADTYRRIRNTVRFLLGNLNDFDPGQHTLPPEQLLELDRWAVDRAFQLQQQVSDDYENYQFLKIYQNVQQFCAIDMGAFYLDIIKDRLYTMPADSLARRSAQTAMYHIAEALVRWIAPILSFTAEEIWQALPGERADSVLLATWYDGLYAMPDAEARRSHWQHLIAVRDEVGKAIETLRVAGKVGSSLAANVTIYADQDLMKDLEPIAGELRFLLITSKADLDQLEDMPGGAMVFETGAGKFGLLVQASSAAKCIRCWHYRDDVGNDPDHPEICSRCVENVVGDGEARSFA